MANIAELRRALREAALRFVDEVIAIAARHASAFAPPMARESGAPVKRARRKVARLHAIGEDVVRALTAKSRLSVSEIARELGRTPSEIGRPITLLLAAGRITKQGERRGTRYLIAGRTRPLPRPGRAAPAKPKKKKRRR